jgi:hypothetical protein
MWDDWERDWLDAYPLDAVPIESRRLLIEARRFVPVIGQSLFDARFKVLDGRKLLDLLDLNAVSPARLEQLAGAPNKVVDLKGLTPCAQLAAFRMIREWRRIPEDRLDRLMTDWLIKLGRERRTLN